MEEWTSFQTVLSWWGRWGHGGDTEGKPSVQGGSCFTESQKQPSGWQITKLGRGSSGASVGNYTASWGVHPAPSDSWYWDHCSLCFKTPQYPEVLFLSFSVQDPAIQRISWGLGPTRAKGPENLWLWVLNLKVCEKGAERAIDEVH